VTTTRYEITMRGLAGQWWLLGYTARRTKGAVFDYVRAYREEIRSHTGEQELLWKHGNWAARGYFYTADGAWQFGLSGRTQLQAQHEGELPRVAKREEAAA
jgi:hypothetical protein